MGFYNPTSKYLVFHVVQLLVSIVLMFSYIIFVYPNTDAIHFLQFSLMIIAFLTMFWFFRIRNKWVYRDDDIVIYTQINGLGYFFVKVCRGGESIFEEVYWAKKYINLSGIDDFKIEFNAFIGGNAVTQCKLVKNSTILLPN